MEYKYSLEKGSKKYVCPNCDKRRFVRYVDNKTGKHLPEKYGKCDREENCAYHLNPIKDGYKNGNKEYNTNYTTTHFFKKKKRERFFIPSKIFRQTLKDYEQNIFIQNLLKNVPFPMNIKDIETIIALYGLGTISKGYREGAVSFPFIDKQKRVRAIQVKNFDSHNHTTATDYIHSIIDKHYQKQKKSLPDWLSNYKKNDKMVSCFFGEHLLKKYLYNPIGLVEAPKTAVYCNLYFGFPELPDDFLWLAVYNRSSLTFDRCKALKGRKVFLFPDLSKDGSTYELWEKRAKEMTNKLPGTSFIVSSLLEQVAGKESKAKGGDLADFLIKQDWRLFRKNIQNELSQIMKEELKAQPPIKPNHQKSEKVETAINNDKSINITNSNFSGQINLFDNTEKPDTRETTSNTNNACLIDKDGKVYIETPGADTFTIYTNLQTFNSRSEIPQFKKKSEVKTSEFKVIHIDS